MPLRGNPLFLKSLPLLLLAAACSSSPAVWRLDTLQGVTYPPLVTRLTYCDPDPTSPLTFELLHGELGEEAFLSLTRHKFHPSPPLPSCPENRPSLKTKLIVEGESYEELSPLFQGEMRVRLSREMTLKIIDSLKRGTPVILEVDGFEKRLESGPFSSLFADWEKGGGFLKNLFPKNLLKGPIE